MNPAVALTVTHWEARRYWVDSQSGEPPYLVDMEHTDEPGRKPRPKCDCWPFKKNKKTCSHVEAVEAHEAQEQIKELPY